MMRKTFISKSHLITIVAVFLAAATAGAAPLTISSVEQETGGPFPHSLFHDARHGESGRVLGWLDLDPAAASTFDPRTGDLVLHVLVYGDRNLQSLIGRASGTGNLPTERFTVLDGSTPGTNAVLGTIDWRIDLLGNSRLQRHLGSQLGPDPLGDGYRITQTFLDHHYVTSRGGFEANSWQGRSLTLWGADGFGKDGTFANALLGTDVVVVATPEPASLTFLWMAAPAIVLAARRRKRA